MKEFWQPSIGHGPLRWNVVSLYITYTGSTPMACRGALIPNLGSRPYLGLSSIFRVLVPIWALIRISVSCCPYLGWHRYFWVPSLILGWCLPTAVLGISLQVVPTQYGAASSGRIVPQQSTPPLRARHPRPVKKGITFVLSQWPSWNQESICDPTILGVGEIG